MMGNFFIKNIIESTNAIAKKINQGLANIFNRKLSSQASIILSEIRPLVASALISSNEIKSLSSGALKIDFGLTSDPSGAIVNAIVDSLDIDIKKATGTAAGIKGGLLITMQPIDYNNLFSLSVAEQITEKGVSLPWLQWLLTFGQQIIVANFGVEYGAGKGRSGGGYMAVDERPFKVSSQHAGTVDDNFITRAIDSVAPQIKSILIKGVQ